MYAQASVMRRALRLMGHRWLRPDSFKSEVLERTSIVSPVLAHLHPKVQVQAPAQHPVQRHPGRTSDPLESLTLGPNDDRLLSLAIDPDRGIHAQLTLLLLELFDLHGDAIGHFLIELQGQLLPDHLGDAKLQAAVGEIPGSIQRRTGRELPGDGGAQRFDIVTLESG